ncbi:hypothetical protein HQ520_17870, partial [bacterium]|nr:hypothetical protein [bacterium]
SAVAPQGVAGGYDGGIRVIPTTLSANGPGRGQFGANLSPGGGAGYGGTGGGNSSDIYGCEGGPSYGTSLLHEIQGGSGGAGGNRDLSLGTPYNTGGGAGGGAIEISALGTVTIDAGTTISVNGGNGGDYLPSSCATGGGGSGGSILLSGDQVINNGSLQVRGGNGGNNGGESAGDRGSGGGAGGRIALFFGSELMAGQYDLSPGQGGSGYGTDSAQPGNPGSEGSYSYFGDFADELVPPNDIPAGPPGAPAEGLGGLDLPDMNGTVSPTGPAISMISEVTYPDETLVITGENLENAVLRIWSEGETTLVQPLRTYSNRIQAVVPASLTTSTMLVWPVTSEASGVPIRVNGATAWWGWPARFIRTDLPVTGASAPWSIWPASLPGLATTSDGDPDDPTVFRIMGKNLWLKTAQPRAWLQGPGVSQWIEILSADPYTLEMRLPDGLTPGTYQVWAHNGTGGIWGWSEPVQFTVVQHLGPASPKTFDVNDYGAVPDDGQDDIAAIDAAMADAANADGGIVRFGQGEYNISRRVETPLDVPGGVRFIGVGMGDHDPDTHAISGTYTLIKYIEGQTLPHALFRLVTPYCRIEGMSLVNGADSQSNIWGYTAQGQIVLAVLEHDAVIRDTRIVMEDRRPDVPQDERADIEFRYGAFLIDAPGTANIWITGYEVHSPGTGVQIHDYTPEYTSSEPPPPSTNYLRIDNTIFRGYFENFYKIPPADGSGWGYFGSRRSAIVNYNAKCFIVENCDFRGADKANRKMFNRTILTYNTSIHNCYYAHNFSYDMGTRRALETTRKNNQGEQYLFHFRYPYGGYFDVTDAGVDFVAVNPNDPRYDGVVEDVIRQDDYTGSRILPEVGQNDHWMVYVAKGKGVGQIRLVTAVERTTNRAELAIDKPWRIIPDSTASFVLSPFYRENIVFDNTVDAGIVDTNSKTGGTQFWFNTFNNIVAGNRFRNLSYGVVFNSAFRLPTGWNLARDNEITNTSGYSGAGSYSASCYTDHYYLNNFATNPAVVASSPAQHWYEVGNIFRSNVCNDATRAGIVHGYDGGNLGRMDQVTPQPDAGLMMHVVENNVFTDMDNGLMVNPPATWPLFRHNSIDATPPVYDPSGGNTEGLLLIE